MVVSNPNRLVETDADTKMRNVMGCRITIVSSAADPSDSGFDDGDDDVGKVVVG